MTQNENMSLNPFVRFWGVLVFCFLFLTFCILSLALFHTEPSVSVQDIAETSAAVAEIPLIEDLVPQEDSSLPIVEVSFNESAVRKTESFFTEELADSLGSMVTDYENQLDPGLEFYRALPTRTAVEWFYTNVTGDMDVALAILQEADKNNIPLSLAFSLAYTESRYKPRAINRNTNASIDRGVFQLNNKSFPALVEADFYDPYISAKYGLAHLRFCLDTAGNEVSALAMYNAGTNRVRNNGTPQMTLNYISKIQTYRQGLDELFESEVMAVYDHAGDSAIAMLTK
ncbi:MAG: transglycosylase SLT domain-containing protein [Treponema sp.]|nr:transglycosylase SLT domain-containing protein [Treponema sp.]